MSILLNSQAYEVKPDRLVYDANHPIDVKVINVASGSGKIKKGTVLALTSAGTYVVKGVALAEGVTSRANCIVAEDVDTGSTNGSNIPVEVYVSGHFNTNELVVADTYTLTVTDKEELRNAGIYLDAANTK